MAIRERIPFFMLKREGSDPFTRWGVVVGCGVGGGGWPIVEGLGG